MDWGTGEYELTAARLAPAAEVAVAALRLRGGERVLDVGTGTGNAALAAARAGARVTGIDPAARLVEVARDRAQAEGLSAAFAVGDATALEAPDGAFDAAVSVFAVIFTEAEASAAELTRVVRPGGRIVLTTWTTDGTTARAIEAMRAALEMPPQPPRWSDPAFVEALFAPHAVGFEQHALAFPAPSAEAYVREQVERHPMWLAARPELERRGRVDEGIETVTAIYAEANEDPAAFRTTSDYTVVTVDLRTG